MLLLFDDAAIPWEVPKIRQESVDWMRTTRKKAVSLGFMTHSLSDVFSRESELGPMLVESCPVRFYLANLREVTGPVLSLLLAMTGRGVAVADLAGDGVSVLATRM